MGSKYQWECLLKDPIITEQLVELVADLIVRGKNITEINLALNIPFPEMDYITCGKFRALAFKHLHRLADKIDKSNYIALSIHRLQRLMANDNEKTKNILAADKQLTDLLGLAEVDTSKDSPEEFARRIREEIHMMDASVPGADGFCKNGKDCSICNGGEADGTTNSNKEATTNPETSKAKPEAVPPATEESGTISKEEEQQLKIARVRLLKKNIANEEK